MNYHKIYTVFSRYKRVIPIMTECERDKLKEDKETLYNYIAELLNSQKQYILNQLKISTFSEYIDEYINKEYDYSINIYYVPDLAERVITDFIQFVKKKVLPIPDMHKQVWLGPFDFVTKFYEAESKDSISMILLMN